MGANTNRNERLISVSNFVRVCANEYIKKQKKKTYVVLSLPSVREGTNSKM